MKQGNAKCIALVSARDALAVDGDLPPLREALLAHGAQVATPCWDDAAVDWAQYDAAVLRSTWDYAERLDEFLAWAGRCAAQTRLFNPPDVVRWNTDKRYLVELARAGVPVVPTRYVAPGADAAAELARFLGGGGTLTIGHADGFSEFVVKPAVGAGSRDVARYERGDVARAEAHLARLLVAGRDAMLQPYLGRVEEHGETAVIYLGDEFSHAVRKGALLRSGAEFAAGLFAPEEIRARAADDDERRVAAAACAAIPFEGLLYARIDLIRGDDGVPVVLEVELTEPSLFFARAPGSARRLAAALLERCAARPRC
jgi:glutathione synthase/RimK-type ligase-like ATP-grasp enzyme